MTVKKRFVFDAVTGTVLFILTAVRRGLLVAGEIQDVFGILSDCFVIPGIILLGCGLLSFAAGEGIFDMLAYSAYFLVKPHCGEDYYQYKCRRREKRTRYNGTLFVGLVFLIIGAVFLTVYFIA